MFFRTALFLMATLVACRTLHNTDRPRPVSKGLPGTILLHDNLWLDQNEISNVDWREFVGWTARMHGIGSPEYRATLPDSVFWLTRADLSTEPGHESYFREPPYNEYPVTGISYDQAVAYCQWRTERVREAVCKSPEEKSAMPQHFRYRLPTITEWEYAASAGLDPDKYPWGFEEFSTKSEHYKAITKESLPQGANPEQTFGLPRGSGTPNRFGFSDLIGNAAEMVAERGIAKGGSYAHSLDESRVKSLIYYKEPMPWLGFRCICEVKK